MQILRVYKHNYWLGFALLLIMLAVTTCSGMPAQGYGKAEIGTLTILPLAKPEQAASNRFPQQQTLPDQELSAQLYMDASPSRFGMVDRQCC